MPVIALDLGGTKLATALFAEDGTILHQDRVQLENRKGKEVANLISKQIEAFIEKANTIDQRITAIGICVPGIAYHANGHVWAPNISGWEDYPLLEQLKEQVKNIPIKIDSDRACYILGEVWKGSAVGCRDAIFLAVGTGIGAGILVNNQVLRGAHDIAGAIGWMALDRPFREAFITTGCFESNASGPGIVHTASRLRADHSSGLSVNATTKEIFDAYEKGDELAKKVIDNAIECWGMTVANLVSLFNPEKIIFGGGVFGPALQFLVPIYEEAKKWAQPISIKQVTLQGSALGTDAGLYGAAWLALKD